MFHIEGPASAIEELERNMRLNEDILRYLTVKIDKLPDGPSVMMTARPDVRDAQIVTKTTFLLKATRPAIPN